jgi:hypothetical protein
MKLAIVAGEINGVSSALSAARSGAFDDGIKWALGADYRPDLMVTGKYAKISLDEFNDHPASN